MALRTGERIGVYEITGPLGKGGMGEVYRGRDTKLDREVAVKVLPEALARDHERLIRFEREAKALAALNHPNIAQIYAVEGSAFIMELVPGETLGDRIKRGAIPLEEALTIASQMASALDAAHEKGIIHRDFKPGNVMVTPEGVVKVLDFGLVGRAPAVSNGNASVDPEDSPTLTLAATQAGFIMGTAAYMAPEQASGKPVDKRADIWSFGVVLWETLTGRRLFEGETISHVLAAVLTKEPDLSAIPVRVRPLLQRCLEKDPRKRLRDIGDAIGLVGAAGAGPVEPVMQAQKRGPTWLWAVAGVMALAAASLVVMLYSGKGAPEGTQVLDLAMLPPDGVSWLNTSTPALSPDGKRIAFAGLSADGKSQLWIRDLNSSVARALTGTEGGHNPFWSPDGQSIGFFAAASLKRIGIDGGGAITVCTTRSQRTIGGAWSKRGVILFSGDFNGPLFRVPAAGGSPEPATTLDKSAGETSHRVPWFLPDGRHFLYSARVPTDEEIKSAVYLGDLDSHERTKVLGNGGGQTVWAPGSRGDAAKGMLISARVEGNVVAQAFDPDSLKLSGEPIPLVEQVDKTAGVWGQYQFTVSQTGLLAFTNVGTNSKTLTILDRAGKVIRAVGAPAAFGSVRFSPNGDRLVSDIYASGSSRDVWVYDVARGIGSRVTSSSYNENPVFAPDGKGVIYAARANANAAETAIIRKEILGGEVILAASKDVLLGGNRRFDMAPDGSMLFVDARAVSGVRGPDIWKVPMLPAPGKPQPQVSTPFSERNPAVSPNSRWLAYTSDEGGGSEIFVDSLPDGGHKLQVSSGRALFPVWGKDGKEIFYVNLEGTMMAVDITERAGGITAGTPKSLFSVGLEPGSLGTFDVNAKGEFAIAVGPRRAVQPLNIIVNWQARMRK